MSEEEGIPSPLRMVPPRPPHVHMGMEVHELEPKKRTFLEELAVMMLIAIGIAATAVFSAYTPGSLADYVGTAAWACWNCAAALAIFESSRNSERDRALERMAKIINGTIKKFHDKHI